jgi:arylsulfatase A-like enzyme
MNKKVLLITIDSLRADHVSCLGYRRKTTPTIDALARNGLLFTRAIANGSSTPTSFLSILTSSYPSMYGYHPCLSMSRTTVAEVLKSNGYHTAAFHSNPYLSRYYGYDRGFDTFEDFVFTPRGRLNMKITTGEIKLVPTEGKKSDTKKRITRPYLLKGTYGFIREFFSHNLELFTPLSAPYETADIINKRAISWLRHHSDNFFLWIHYMDTHFPYQPSRNYLNKLQIKGIAKAQIRELRRRMQEQLLYKSRQLLEKDLVKLVDLYDAMIRYTDDAVGSILAGLKSVGAYDDTFVLVASDHGEEFNEHGRLGHFANLHDELIRVPLVIKLPGSRGGKVIDYQVQLLDVAPTILQFLGIDKPEGFQGTSVMPLIEEKERQYTTTEGIISETIHNRGVIPGDGIGKRLTCYRTKDWKYIIDEETGQSELYNLQDDPHETNNLVEREPEKAARYRSRIMQHIEMEEKSKERHITTEKKRLQRKIRAWRKAYLA